MTRDGSEEEAFERFCLRHLGEIARLALWAEGGPLQLEPRRIAALFVTLRADWQKLSPSERLASLHRAALGRPPSAEERMLAALLHSGFEEPVQSRLLAQALESGGAGPDFARLLSAWEERGGEGGAARVSAALRALRERSVARGEEDCPRGRLLADRAAGRLPLPERDRLDRHVLLCPRCETNEDAIRVRLIWSATGPESEALYEGTDSLLLPWERRPLLSLCLGPTPSRFRWLRRSE